MQLAGTVALVTGGSSGIGTEIVRELAARGARPLIAGRDPGRLASVAAETGGVPLQADLATPEGPAALVTAALREAGQIDLLISNAGVGCAAPIGQTSAAKVEELIAVNLTAHIQLARLLVPRMAERGRGRIVFVSSVAGATGVRDEVVYAAAKAGLNCFAESIAYDLADRGVGVSVVYPGPVDTPFFENRGSAYLRRMPAPIPAARIAAAVIKVIEQERDEIFVPGWMRFAARLHGIAPRMFRALASRFDKPAGGRQRVKPRPFPAKDITS